MANSLNNFPGRSYSALASSHLNPVLSGVAKFNLVLGKKLGIAVCGLEPSALDEASSGPILISTKIQDLSPSEMELAFSFFQKLEAHKRPFDLFLHTFDSLPLETQLIAHCRKVYCGNNELLLKVAKPEKTVLSWCPGLLDEKQIRIESPLNLFCFGMAHKIQLWTHKALHSALEKMEVDYSLWLSTAFHEKANFGDFNTVSRALIDIYGKRVRFLGFLSDESVNYFLAKTNAFVAFFERGVRANNTTVNAALERGCPVITNMDAQSPAWMVHGKNVIDVGEMAPTDLEPSALLRVGKQGAADVALNASWERLISQLKEGEWNL
jgi:hypothetical protein